MNEKPMSFIESIIDDSIQTSNAPHPQHLKRLLKNHYGETYKQFTNAEEALQHIYSTPSETHMSMYLTDEGVFIMDVNHRHPSSSEFGSLAAELRHEYQEGNMLLEQLLDELEKMRDAVKQVEQRLEQQFLCTRKWSAETKPEPEYPSIAVMTVFNECGRKKKYVTEQEAEKHLELPNLVYSCPHCKNWHQGREKNLTLPEEKRVKRIKGVWRRYNHI